MPGACDDDLNTLPTPVAGMKMRSDSTANMRRILALWHVARRVNRGFTMASNGRISGGENLSSEQFWPGAAEKRTPYLVGRPQSPGLPAQNPDGQRHHGEARPAIGRQDSDPVGQESEGQGQRDAGHVL